jgi:glycosyltransferase involved in cell wall biosynthesis
MSSRFRSQSWDRPLVIVLGPAPGGPGGVSSVMAQVKEEYASINAFEVIFIQTVLKGRWSVGAFVLSYFRTIGMLVSGKVLKRPIVVHLNVASRGSTYRKILFSVLCRVTRTPYICHIHGGRYRQFYRGAPWWMKWCIRSFFATASRVIVLGEVWKRFFVEEIGLAEVSVVSIPNGSSGVPVSSVPQRRQASKVSLVFSGRIEERKGVPVLLAALENLRLDLDNFTVTMLGESCDPVLAQQLQDRTYCVAPGWVNAAEVRRVMSAADIFVLPSLNEGLPMAMVEAMSAGLPVIVTAVGSIPDVIDDGEEGYLVPPAEVLPLENAIRKLISDRQLRLSMGRKARAKWERDLRADLMTARISREWELALAGPSEYVNPTRGA